MNQYKHLTVTVGDHAAEINIHRPPVNALNRELVNDLHTVTRNLARSKEIWSVVLRSTLSVFSAGADLKERAAMTSAGINAASSNIQKMVHEFYSLPQPLIVEVDGHALGGGLELALAGDFLVASDRAVFGFPEVGLGMIPGAGGTQLLARRTSAGVARRWILSGKKYTSVEALNDGVVDMVVPAAELAAEIRRIRDSIRAQAPRALQQAKKAINGGIGLSLDRGLRVERSCYGSLLSTRDRSEALQAFLEKRTPVWQGK